MKKAPVEQSEGNKYEYTVSFSDAARIVLSHLRRKDAQTEEELLERVKKHLTPIRPGRTAPRDKKGVARLSKWMQYRPARQRTKRTKRSLYSEFKQKNENKFERDRCPHLSICRAQKQETMQLAAKGPA